MEAKEKVTAILSRPDAQPVQVEITDADGKSWTAIVQTPAGLELFVSVDDLHCVESVDKNGRYEFLGEPRRRTDETMPNYLVVKDRKEVLV